MIGGVSAAAFQGPTRIEHRSEFLWQCCFFLSVLLGIGLGCFAISLIHWIARKQFIHTLFPTQVSAPQAGKPSMAMPMHM